MAQAQAAQPKQNILVIGAGLAGLGAARSLLSQGHQVRVLEARDRIGGRIWTSTRWPDAPLDMGASWIHGVEGNPLTQLADNLKAQRLPTSYESNRVYAPSGQPLNPAQTKHLEALRSRIEKAIQAAQSADADQSVRSAVAKALNWPKLSPADRQWADFILNSTLEQEYAGSVAQLSTHWYDAAKAFDGDDALFAQGFRVIAEGLAEGATVELGQTVRSIDWSGPGVRVITQKATLEADKAIVTLPLGVLKANAVQFSPALPAPKQTAIERLGMGVLNKCYLRFAKAFWPTDVDWLEHIPPKYGEWTEWVSFMKAAKLPVLLGFNAADQGRAIEAWSDAQIVNSAIGTLRRLYGPSIPDPLDFQITRWASDPFALGSYSFNALGSTPKMRDHLAAPLGNKVFFAGEATERNHFGSAHGAYLSGLRAAKEIGRL